MRLVLYDNICLSCRGGGVDDTILNTTVIVDPPIPGSSPSTSAKTDTGKLSTFPTLGQGLLFEGRKKLPLTHFVFRNTYFC